jgi:hypothetical protein
VLIISGLSRVTVRSCHAAPLTTALITRARAGATGTAVGGAEDEDWVVPVTTPASAATSSAPSTHAPTRPTITVWIARLRRPAAFQPAPGRLAARSLRTSASSALAVKSPADQTPPGAIRL